MTQRTKTNENAWSEKTTRRLDSIETKPGEVLTSLEDAAEMHLVLASSLRVF